MIKSALEKGEITENRPHGKCKENSENQIFIRTSNLKSINSENINEDLNNASHAELSEKLYSNAITLLKDEKNLLPLSCSETYYYLPLEEAPFQNFRKFKFRNYRKMISKNEIAQIPENSTVIVGFHKDNSTAYKSYKISQESKDILAELKQKQNVILDVFGSLRFERC